MFTWIARHMDQQKFLEHFPNIYAKCLSIGIDVSKDMIPVSPLHIIVVVELKQMNGATLQSKIYMQQVNVPVPVHGANRLASNSLLEAMVFAHRALPGCSKKY